MSAVATTTSPTSALKSRSRFETSVGVVRSSVALDGGRIRSMRRKIWPMRIGAKLGGGGGKNPLQYRNLGDSDLNICEITLGTMTFGEQNTEKEAHEILSFAFEHGINALDTAEMYPVPPRKETQGRTDLYISNWMKSKSRDKIILATKVSGYSERTTYLRENGKAVRVDAANIKESVEKSLKRLSTDYIDLLQIH